MKVVNTAGQILQQGGAGGGATFTGGFSTQGNTAGNTGMVTGQLLMVGGNNVTLSGSTNAGSITVTISGPNTAAQSTQSAIKALGVSNTGNTAGNTGVSTGIDWVIAGTNMITASESTAGGGPNTIWLNATQSVQTQGITGDQLSVGVSTGGNTSGNTTVNSGTRIVFVGSNGVTLSQGTAAGATTITISGITQSIQTQGITGDQLSIGVSTGGNTSGNTTVNSGTRIVFVGSNGVTLSQGTAAGATTITISGVTTAAQTTQSAIKALGVSNTGNTAGDTGVSTGIDWVVAGSNNITISESTVGGGPNTIWVSGANAGAAQYSIGVSTGGNTSGTTGVTGTRIVFAGINNITLSQSNDATGATITISGPAAGGFSAGASNLGNTAGSTGVTGTRLVLVGSNNISLSQATDANGGTVSFIGQAPLSTYEPYPAYGHSTQTVAINANTSARVTVIPFVVALPVSAGIMNMMFTANFTTVGTSSGRQTAGIAMALYTLNVSTLSSLISNSFSWQVTGNNSSYTINQVTSTAYSGFGATGATNSAGINITSGYTGVKLVGWPISSLLTPGPYWLAIMGTNSTSSINVGMTMGFWGAVLNTAQSAGGPIGSFSSAYSLGQDPRGGRWAIGNGIWSSAGSVTMVPISMNLTSISADAGGSVAPFMKFWST